MSEEAAAAFMRHERIKPHVDPYLHSEGKPIVLQSALVAVSRKMSPEEVEEQARAVLAAHPGVDFHIETRGDMHRVFFYKKV